MLFPPKINSRLSAFVAFSQNNRCDVGFICAKLYNLSFRLRLKNVKLSELRITAKTVYIGINKNSESAVKYRCKAFLPHKRLNVRIS